MSRVLLLRAKMTPRQVAKNVLIGQTWVNKRKLHISVGITQAYRKDRIVHVRVLNRDSGVVESGSLRFAELSSDYLLAAESRVPRPLAERLRVAGRLVRTDR